MLARMSEAAPFSPHSSSPHSGSPDSGTPNSAAHPDEVPTVNPFVYRAVVAAMHLPTVLAGQRVEVQGRENVPPPGTPLVVAANHRSALDPFMVARAMPPGRFLQFMAKQELFVPVVGDIIRAGGSFPVDRSGNDVHAIRTAVRILQRGGTVGIFPQGTRGGTAVQGGVALIAAKGRAPILPVGIRLDGQRWVVRFGVPLESRGGVKAVTHDLGFALLRLVQP